MVSTRSKARPDALPAELPRAQKATRGRTAVAETPLAIRTTGIDIPASLETRVRTVLARRFLKFGNNLERVTVRFEDHDGPRGGVAIECRIKVVLPGLPSLVVNERAADAQRAFDVASHAVVRAVGRALERAGYSKGRTVTRGRARRPARDTGTGSAPAESGRVGRRVAAGLGRVEKQRGDARADTSAPQVRSTQRKAPPKTTRAAAALESPARAASLRKPTRKSANRKRPAGDLALRAARESSSPSARAESARVRRPR